MTYNPAAEGERAAKRDVLDSIETRAIEAMLMTWNAIGHDLEAAGGEGSLDNATLRDVIPDSNHLEWYGDDPEAVKWFRALGYEQQQVVLKRAFK